MFLQRRYTRGQQGCETLLSTTRHQGRADQSRQLGWPQSETQKTTSVLRVWGNRTPCALLVGMNNGAATMENSMAGPQKTKQNYRTAQ